MLINTEVQDIIQVALEEFRQEKIWLVSGEEADELREQRLCVDQIGCDGRFGHVLRNPPWQLPVV